MVKWSRTIMFGELAVNYQLNKRTDHRQTVGLCRSTACLMFSTFRSHLAATIGPSRSFLIWIFGRARVDCGRSFLFC